MDIELQFLARDLEEFIQEVNKEIESDKKLNKYVEEIKIIMLRHLSPVLSDR
jgi:hypothetical protein